MKYLIVASGLIIVVGVASLWVWIAPVPPPPEHGWIGPGTLKWQRKVSNSSRNTQKNKPGLGYLLLKDNTFLNAEIIREGYGFAYSRFPFKYLDEFRESERETRQQGNNGGRNYQ